ncbi:ComF family protein [Corynebacterium lubricantis]|uniref:ComF family protein n=1 Tax=Corynebacterium lubricantis TaxID=541095 RepID=UPI0004768FD5|nr:phosphoribosyltransferase family protein [Corynebacterium lubricantis]
MIELLLPRHCAGCGAPGEHLCAECKHELARPPERVVTRESPHVPVFSLGPYAGAHRQVILSMKERKNIAIRRMLGAVLRAGLEHLEARGELPTPTVLVPAPTRAFSARQRGGDPVTAVCRATGRTVVPVVSLAEGVRDQTELDAAGRRRNLSGGIILSGVPRGTIVVVDDVVTTGATLQATVENLVARGATVAGAVTIAAA